MVGFPLFRFYNLILYISSLNRLSRFLNRFSSSLSSIRLGTPLCHQDVFWWFNLLLSLFLQKTSFAISWYLYESFDILRWIYNIKVITELFSSIFSVCHFNGYSTYYLKWRHIFVSPFLCVTFICCTKLSSTFQIQNISELTFCN